MNVRNILIQEKKQVRLNEKGEDETPKKKILTVVFLRVWVTFL